MKFHNFNDLPHKKVSVLEEKEDFQLDGQFYIKLKT